MLMILFIMLTGGTALAAGTGSTGSGITAQTVYTYEDDAMKVTATLSDGSAIPTGSTLKVDALTDQTTDENVKALYTDAKTMIDNQAANEKYTLDSFAAYNIYFKKDDNTYVPSTGTMTLEVTYKAANAPEAYTKSTAGGKAVVVYQKTQIKDILGNSTYILSNLGTAKDTDQKDIISKKELDESGNLKALTFKESTYLPVILAWTENNAQAAANGAVTPTPTAAPSVTAAPAAEPSTTADENTDTTVTPTAEPSATAAPSTTVENGNDSGTDKADAANNTVNKDDFTLGDNQTTNEALVDGSTGSGILTDNTAKGVTSTDANGKKIKTYTYKSDDVTVTVTADDTSALPDGAVLKVTPQTVDKDLQTKLNEKASSDNVGIRSVLVYDISFVFNGIEVEPSNAVSVSISTTNVKAGDQATVYHVSDDQTKGLEDVKASTTNDGKVEFSAKQFSNYVIINGNNLTPITVKVNHLNADDSDKVIYSADTYTLEGAKQLDNYAKAATPDNTGKADCWNVEKVSVTDEATNKKTDYSAEAEWKSIKLTANSTVDVYYTANTQNFYGSVNFYDYIKGTSGIDSASNYTGGDANSRISTIGSNTNTTVKNKYNNVDVTKYINSYIAGTTKEGYSTNGHDYLSIVQGLLTGVDSNGDPVWGKNSNGNQLYDPGFFTTTAKTGKTLYNSDQYKLYFSQNGNTSTLGKMTDGSTATSDKEQPVWYSSNPGTVAYTATTAKTNNFFPLNNQNNNYKNEYFGMKYKINFSLGDYVGDLTYKFTGDDDLWVVLDDTTVLDMGGIHGYETGSIDLWTGTVTYTTREGSTDTNTTTVVQGTGILEKLGYTDADENNLAVLDLTGKGHLDAKTATHTITVFYMERGGNLSNCNMQYTLPKAQIADISDVPTTDITINKVKTDNTTAVGGATFELKNSAGTVVGTQTSNSSGALTFSKLREGTYTLTETSAPDGYVRSTDTWKVVVTVSADKVASAVLQDSSGNVIAENKIQNKTEEEKVKEEVEYSKTSKVSSWTDRTYDINITAASKVSSTTTTTSAGTADVMLVLDRSGSMGDYTYTNEGIYSSVNSSLNTSSTYYMYLNGEYYKMSYINNGKKSKQWWFSYYGTYYQCSSYNTFSVYSKSSTTKMDDLKTAAKSFVDGMSSNSPTSKIGIASFSSVGYGGGNLDKSLVEIGSDTSAFKTAINGLNAYGGTSPELALSKAYSELTSDTAKADGNPKVVILFTDGEPTGEHNMSGLDSNNTNYWDSKSATETQIKALKDQGITVYTVGLGLGTNATTWLSGTIASSPDKAYTASTADQLQQLFKEIQNQITHYSSVSGATIKDTIDSRFDVLGDDDTVITTETVGDDGTKTLGNGGTLTLASSGGKVGYDSSTGLFYVIWENATIPNKNATSGATSWTKTIKVKAKDNYIGGNDVTTNASDSYIEVDGNQSPLGQPKVNVKSDFDISNAETTIFWGDSVKEGSTLDDVTAQIVKQAVAKYNLSVNDFTVTYYSDSNYTDQITDTSLIANAQPEMDTVYYAKVTYNNLGASSQESLTNTTDSSGAAHISGDASEINVNSTLTKYPATFTVHVVKGQIQITKTIDNQYSNIGAINSNQTFVFRIQRYNLNVAGTGPDSGAATDTFYETINFNANQTVTTKSKIISQLKKGWYVVTEETSWSPKYSIDGSSETGYFVGKNLGIYSNSNKTIFTGLEVYDNTKPNTNAKTYEQYAVLGTVGNNGDISVATETTPLTYNFTNKLKNGWNWLSDTAAAVNQFTKTTKTSN